ncbi:unnamed protein product [Moneuplotes crassus]|uniref:Uncharacterized protein n=1 Tax=Euplotes crassus TaxID=5936 RepID=A0AAD1U1W9_EUPCR|nr:unnamed protein product [Moneuplotes crassus]
MNNPKSITQKLTEIIETKEYLVTMYVCTFVWLIYLLGVRMTDDGIGAYFCYFFFNLYLAVTNLIFFLTAASEVTITTLIKKDPVVSLNGNPNFAGNGHPNVFNNGSQNPVNNGHPNPVNNVNPNPAAKGKPPIVVNGADNHVAVVPMNNHGSEEEKDPEPKPSTEENPTWLLILSIFIGYFWYALFCLLQKTKENTRKPDRATMRKHILLVCGISSLQWLLCLILPVVTFKGSAAGFWLSFLWMIYLQGFCYTVYFQTRAYLFEVKWVPYFSPVTWLFMIGGYTSMICGTNKHNPNTQEKPVNLSGAPLNQNEMYGNQYPPHPVDANGNLIIHPRANTLADLNDQRQANGPEQLDDPEQDPHQHPGVNKENIFHPKNQVAPDQ